MSTENNQTDYQNTGGARYQPPSNYNGSNSSSPNTSNTNNNMNTGSWGSAWNGNSYSWPSADGTNNPNPNVNYGGPPQPPVQPVLPTFDPQTELYRQAVRRADAKLRFFKHLRSYILVNAILWGIAIITIIGNWGWQSGGHRWEFWGAFWPIWVTIFWGVGLISEYVNLFVMNDHRKQNMIEEELRRMRR